MKANRIFSIALIAMLLCGAFIRSTQAQNPIKETDRADYTLANGGIHFANLLARVRPHRRTRFSLMPTSSVNTSGAVFTITPTAPVPNLPVSGGGTLGRLTKWTGFTSSNSVIGDSKIFEDKFGNVGIGTDSPTSRLSVVGTIEATGGFKFPAGAHDATLKGDGTTASPLGVAIPLNLTGESTILSATNTGSGFGVLGTAHNGAGIAGISDNGVAIAGFSFIGSGVIGNTDSGTGVTGQSIKGDGIRGVSFATSTTAAGVRGRCVTACTGVLGESTSGTGVFGKSTDVAGVRGQSTNGPGVFGESDNSHAVQGNSASNSPNNAGVAGFSSSIVAGGIAGRFGGNVRIEPNNGQPGDLIVAGKLQVTSGMKMFHIDHPLDPENKYLNHAAIESSEVLNVYSGNVTTDTNGDAIVTLPDWFEALNKDFRYQLTVLGTFAQAIVADEIKNNRFAIKTNAANVKVSWQVTGVRSDPTAHKYKFEIEEEKGERERGYYLSPDAFNQPEEKSIQWGRDPEGMQRLKQQRLEAEQIRKQQASNQQ